MPIIGHRLWNVEQCLPANVEFCCEGQLPAFVEPEPRANIIKRISDRERCRSQHTRGYALEQPVTQHSRDINRTGVQKNSSIAPLDPGDVVFEIPAAEHAEFAFKFSGTARQGFILAGKILLLFDLIAGFLKSADQRIDAVEAADRVPALAEQRESVEESLGSARDGVDIRFQLSCIVNEFGQAIVADVKSEIFGRDIFEIMRFVEDDRRVVREYRRD